MNCIYPTVRLSQLFLNQVDFDPIQILFQLSCRDTPAASGMATGRYGGGKGAIAPPLLPKGGPRDSFKIEEKMVGYRFCKNLSEKWPDEIT